MRYKNNREIGRATWYHGRTYEESLRHISAMEEDIFRDDLEFNEQLEERIIQGCLKYSILKKRQNENKRKDT